MSNIIKESSIETGDLSSLPMPAMTTGQFSEYTKKIETQTVDLVISKLEEVLEPKTTPELIRCIVEDLKDAIFDL